MTTSYEALDPPDYSCLAALAPLHAIEIKTGIE